MQQEYVDYIKIGKSIYIINSVEKVDGCPGRTRYLCRRQSGRRVYSITVYEDGTTSKAVPYKKKFSLPSQLSANNSGVRQPS